MNVFDWDWDGDLCRDWDLFDSFVTHDRVRFVGAEREQYGVPWKKEEMRDYNGPKLPSIYDGLVDGECFLLFFPFLIEHLHSELEGRLGRHPSPIRT